MNLMYIETSAKTNENVDEAFTKLGEIVIDKISTEEINPNDEVRIQEPYSFFFIRLVSRLESLQEEERCQEMEIL